MRSVAILVDGSNMHATIKALGFSVDWQKVRNTIDEDIPVHKSMYFTAVKPRGESSTIRPLLDYLEHNEWMVIQKPVDVYNNNGERKIKGNMDVEIAVEAMKISDKVTDVILFTGDGDFVCLVKALQDKGVRVSVVSTRHAKPSLLSDRLVRAADVFIDLFNMRGVVERKLPSG